jgi:ketosteroid isomerase-like protein
MRWRDGASAIARGWLPRTIVLAAALLLGVSLLARSQAPPPHHLASVELPPTLARVLSDSEAAWNAPGGEALARLFIEDGIVLPTDRPPVRGAAAIEQYYSDVRGARSLRAIAYAMDEDVAYIIGGYAESPDGPDVGKFTLTLLRGTDGRWRIASVMGSPNERSQ